MAGVMYPIVSLLRRHAATQIFVRAEQLEVVEKCYWLRLKKPSSYWDLVRATWGLVLDKIPMFVLKVTTPTSEAAAISIVKKENAIAEKLRVEETYYTLVLGPEFEEENDGQVTRTVRLAIVRGVYRASGSFAETLPTKTRIVRRFGKPKGVVYDEP